MSMSVEDHLQIDKELQGEKEAWLPLWKELSNYIVQRRCFWDKDAKGGRLPPVKIYDTTAIKDRKILVDGLQGNLMSAAIPWLDLEMENDEIQKEADVADYLEKLQHIFLSEYARSNFYEETNEILTDLVGLGTGIMFVDDAIESRKIIFSTRHLKECAIAENHEGRVDTLYRNYTMSNRQAEEAWGSKLSKQRRDKAKENPYGKAHILHACYPSNNGNNKKYTSVYIDKDIPETIDIGGYEYFPYLVPRWSKNAGDSYGYCPGSDALPEVLRINQMSRTLLVAGQLSTEPPLNVPESMKGLERIVPRGFNYYSNPNELIKPIELGYRYPIGADQEKQVREQIDEIFRVRVFLLIEQLMNRGSVTATEIRERVAEMASIMAPVISRINAEYLVPLTQITYTICERNGLLPALPEALQKESRVRIKFKGRLAQAQQKYHQSEGIVTGLEFVGAVAQLNESAIDNVNVDELMRKGMNSLGMPQAVIEEEYDVQKKRKMRARALEMQRKQEEEMEQEKMVSANADKLNQPMKPDSMIASAVAEKAKQNAREERGKRK